MSAPIDVLREYAQDTGAFRVTKEGATKLAAACSAIAELIEAAAEVRAAHRELPGLDHPAAARQEGEARIGRAHYALEAALANVSGGAA